jgi:hypothetical protein
MKYILEGWEVMGGGEGRGRVKVYFKRIHLKIFSMLSG